MAAVNLAEITPVLNVILAPRIVAQFDQATKLPRLLDAKKEGAVTAFGIKLRGRTRSGNDTLGAARGDAGGNVINADYGTHIRIQGSVPMARIISTASVDGYAETAAAQIGGASVTDLVDDEIMDASRELGEHLGEKLYSGDGTDVDATGGVVQGIYGLAYITDNTQIYAGQSPITYPEWQAVNSTLPWSQLSFNALTQTLIADYVAANDEYPTFLVAKADVVNKLKEIQGAQVTWMRGMHRIGDREVEVGASVGLRAIDIDGIPLVEDSRCTANTIYAINPRFTFLVYRDRFNKHVVSVQRTVMNSEGLGDPSTESLRRALAQVKPLTEGSSRIIPWVNKLAKTGDSSQYQVGVYVKLECRKRKSIGKLELT